MGSAAEIREAHGGVWGEHPKYPVADWRYQVANDDTRSGYWEWVATELEFAE
ncbi:hypothetical protein [Mycobacteroides chelonae]|uniref:hypothetical protein n=1 Tax=Mycobacteroides chelonae TaxID=1774 RepID=UPI0013F4C844|nr:hypothetical protein [Mycobacteroides chelonae]